MTHTDAVLAELCDGLTARLKRFEDWFEAREFKHDTFTTVRTPTRSGEHVNYEVRIVKHRTGWRLVIRRDEAQEWRLMLAVSLDEKIALVSALPALVAQQDTARADLLDRLTKANAAFDTFFSTLPKVAPTTTPTTTPTVVRNCVCVQCQRVMNAHADLVVVERASDAPSHPTNVVHPDAYLAFVEDHGEDLERARASVKRWSARWL